jgi:hypothetical protein
MWPYELKLDDEKSKHASLVQQNGFGPTISHCLLRLVKGTTKFNTMFDHSCQTKCWMNNYESVYKTRVVTSFANCSLRAKHITSRWMLNWQFKIVSLTKT